MFLIYQKDAFQQRPYKHIAVENDIISIVGTAELFKQFIIESIVYHIRRNDNKLKQDFFFLLRVTEMHSLRIYEKSLIGLDLKYLPVYFKIHNSIFYKQKFVIRMPVHQFSVCGKL